MEQKQVTPEDHHVVIRNAERQDVLLLLEYIRGIARFAKMENEVILRHYTTSTTKKKCLHQHSCKGMIFSQIFIRLFA